MDEEAPADAPAADGAAAAPAPSQADVILQRAQSNSRGADREAEASEAKWATLGGGSALGDGSAVTTDVPALETAPALEALDVRVTFFADGFTVEESKPKAPPPAPKPKPRRGGTASIHDFAAPPRPPPLPSDFPELRPFDSDASREFLDHLARDEVPPALRRPGRRVRFGVADARPMPCPWGPGSPMTQAMGRQPRPAPAPEAPAAFAGSGQALGGASAPAVDAPLPEAPVVDMGKPRARFRLRLASGKALAVELNAEHTVGHLRAYVAAQGAGDEPYDLLAGFPPRPLVDADQSIADAGLAGGAVSQKLRA